MRSLGVVCMRLISLFFSFEYIWVTENIILCWDQFSLFCEYPEPCSLLFLLLALRFLCKRERLTAIFAGLNVIIGAFSGISNRFSCRCARLLLLFGSGMRFFLLLSNEHCYENYWWISPNFHN